MRSLHLEPQMSRAVHHMRVRFVAQLVRLERAQQQAMFDLKQCSWRSHKSAQAVPTTAVVRRATPLVPHRTDRNGRFPTAAQSRMRRFTKRHTH